MLSTTVASFLKNDSEEKQQEDYIFVNCLLKQ